MLYFLIFFDMVKDVIDVLMDDFLAIGYSYDDCLSHLANVLQRYEECKLVLNCEKWNFMVNKGIVLGHKISKRGIEVDKLKIKVNEKLPPLVLVKGIRSFCGHTGFYKRFIKDF